LGAFLFDGEAGYGLYLLSVLTVIISQSLKKMSIISDVFSHAISDFRRAWFQLLTIDLIYKIIAFAIFTPFVGLALRLFLSMSGNSVLADEDILFFVLSPIGLVALVVVSVISLGIIALELACLITIGLASIQNTSIGNLEVLWHNARHIRSILYLAIRIVARLLLIAAPFLAAGGLVYLTLLTHFDINYFLTVKPPVFWIAAGIIGTLFAIMTVLIIHRLIRWILALPLYLLENVSVSEALTGSREITKGHRWKIFLVITGWVGMSLFLWTLTTGAVGLMGRIILPVLRGSMELLVFAMGGLFLLWSGVNLVLSLLAVSALALLIVRLYDRLATPRITERIRSEPIGVSQNRRQWRLSFGKLLAGLVGVTVIAVLVGIFLVDGIHLDDDVIVMAHRGAAGAAPENTLASIKRAIDDNTDFVEIDVQETSDGEIVVIHDSDLMKVGNTNLKIWDATYEQLQSIDVGSWFSPEFSGERVPRLQQVLALCKDKARVNIELKYYGHDKRLEERVVKIVEAEDMVPQIVVMSLKYDAIEKMRKLRPDWTLGLLTAKFVGNLTKLDADFLAVHTGLVNRRFVQSAHKRNKQVFAWTVNDALQMNRMISMGVDGLITDEPALARSVLKERADMNPVEHLLLSLSLQFGIKINQPGPESDI
jgi:glycerophosphoryl diester phosphodiesterase